MNQSISDFPATGFNGVDNYECTVGIDCSTEKFPAHMYTLPVPKGSDSIGVASINIIFEVSKSHEDLILRLARAGSEITLVKIDDEKSYKITSDMLGSDEGRKYGSYDLELGRLDQGVHSIHLSIADESGGNHRYMWDALILISHK